MYKNDEFVEIKNLTKYGFVEYVILCSHYS